MHWIKYWARACMLPFLVSAVVSCGSSHGAVDELFAAADDLNAALCRCPFFGGACDAPTSSCRKQIVRKHAGELGEWLNCAEAQVRDITRCVEASGCSESKVEACLLDPANDACGKPPKAANTAIEREIGLTCAEDIECDDGSMVSGNYCNGRAECDDGSDEEFCDAAGRGSVGAQEEFACNDGGTVPTDFICDGSEDCEDGSDELDCASGDPGVTVHPVFTCLDGQEIDVDFVCDSEPDCSDGDDENACFACRFGSGSGLIRSGLVCDGVRDCVLGDDETAPTCPTGPPSGSVAPGAFTCGNKETIYGAEQVCDDVADCTKGDDEQGCFSCSSDGAHLRMSLTCDRVPDCADGSDELNCPRERTVTTTVTPPSTCNEQTVQRSGLGAPCAACACSTAARETLACDQVCWDLFDCVATNCTNMTDTACIVAKCATVLSAGAAATALVSTLDGACDPECGFK